jgi:hypothetical protein
LDHPGHPGRTGHAVCPDDGTCRAADCLGHAREYKDQPCFLTSTIPVLEHELSRGTSLRCLGPVSRPSALA